jgi:hypothetical protein
MVQDSGSSAGTRPPPARASPSACRPTAFGSQGQYTIVIPSEDLVIVKIGWAYAPNDDHVATARLVKETIAALKSE